jgi:hypothetical protein
MEEPIDFDAELSTAGERACAAVGCIVLDVRQPSS